MFDLEQTECVIPGRAGCMITEHLVNKITELTECLLSKIPLIIYLGQVVQSPIKLTKWFMKIQNINIYILYKNTVLTFINFYLIITIVYIKI